MYQGTKETKRINKQTKNQGKRYKYKMFNNIIHFIFTDIVYFQYL